MAHARLRLFCLYAQWRVDDNGPDMPEETIQSIYHLKPFADTSQRRLCLSVVGLLSKQEGILITYRSQIGIGPSIALLTPKNQIPS